MELNFDSEFAWKKEEAMSAVIRASAQDSEKPSHHNVPVAVLNQLLYLFRSQFRPYKMELRLPASQDRVKVLVHNKDAIMLAITELFIVGKGMCMGAKVSSKRS